MKKIAIFLSLLVLAAGAAVFNTLSPSESTVQFISRQMGVSSSGDFPKFSAKLFYDAKQLNKSKVEFTVDMKAVDMGMAETNEELKGKNWFDVNKYPTAVFVSDELKTQGNQVQVKGRLTLKDVTRPVTFLVTVSEKGNTVSFDGNFDIKRTEFKLGAGEWASVDVVEDVVRVKFHIVARAA